MSRITLDVIDIAKPCPADWDEMRGDEQVRFCKHCSLNVYNLSAMSRAAAEQLVAEREGRVCVRFYRRLDGTVITRDCEGGWKLAAKKLGRFARTATAVVLTAALTPLGFSRWLNAAPTDKSSSSSSTPTVCVKPPEANPRAIMGDMIEPPVPLQGKMLPPAKMGEMAPVPLMGAPAPLPAIQPAATQPAQAATK
ncbi:MAG: hypothetical protein QOE14_384 [Humisphaera sp.]|nr:hypothetical protein [Humisphaera sp.]